MSARILIAEDEASQRKLIAAILQRDGYAVEAVADGEAALDRIQKGHFDLLLSDWQMPKLDGGQLLERLRAEGTEIAFVVMTAFGSIAHAVEAVRLGADDYLAKPFEKEALLLAVSRALKSRRLEVENRRLKQEVAVRDGFGEMVGSSPPMQKLYRMIEKVARTDATVLIAGESGTGKELVARTLHRQSRRADAAFVAVNCAAIPEGLIESELFGHEKGAFTGAHRRREGRFEEASGGTLFLDEIPSMPLSLQAKLLRVLQEGKVQHLGGSGEIDVDVRLLAAANRNLEQMVAEGTFREDLYYRLAVVPVTVPSLRERAEDIGVLSESFLAQAAQRYGVEQPVLPAMVRRRMLAHGWPGNVRELRNLIERMVLLAEDGQIDPEDLPTELGSSDRPDGCPFGLPAEGLDWEAMECGLLTQAMERASGNRAQAAKFLGLSYKAFLYRLEKYEITV